MKFDEKKFRLSLNLSDLSRKECITPRTYGSPLPTTPLLFALRLTKAFRSQVNCTRQTKIKLPKRSTANRLLPSSYARPRAQPTAPGGSAAGCKLKLPHVTDKRSTAEPTAIAKSQSPIPFPIRASCSRRVPRQNQWQHLSAYVAGAQVPPCKWMCMWKRHSCRFMVTCGCH